MAAASSIILYDTEEITVRVFQYHVISAWLVPPRIPVRAQPNESLDLPLLVPRVQVEVDPAAGGCPRHVALLWRDMWPLAVRST